MDYVVPVTAQTFEINTHCAAVCVYMQELMAPVLSGAEEKCS